MGPEPSFAVGDIHPALPILLRSRPEFPKFRVLKVMLRIYIITVGSMEG